MLKYYIGYKQSGIPLGRGQQAIIVVSARVHCGGTAAAFRFYQQWAKGGRSR